MPVFVTVSVGDRFTVYASPWSPKYSKKNISCIAQRYVAQHETHRKLPLHQDPARDARQESRRLFDRTFYLK